MKLSLLVSLLAAAAAVTADITRPKPYTEWPVGSTQVVEVEGNYIEGDTVSIFFNNARDSLLAGGPATQHTFQVQVPEGALSPPGGYSELLVVHRHNFHLQDVESVYVNVTNCEY
ncbi:hypothetical protein Unana1_04129 [Umbelopsis nana]